MKGAKKTKFLPTNQNLTKKLIPAVIFSAGQFHTHLNLTKFYKKDSLADILHRPGDDG